MSSASRPFLEARDLLLARRTDYAAARREFRWPKLEKFNWALDYFDEMAKGNDRPALWVVDDAGEVKLSFAEMSRRSGQVANFLREKGVRRGDAVLMMLGNVVPLWEVMLACMKLGAVIIPATTLLTTDDLRDRFERGKVRHVVVGASDVGKFDALPGEYGRFVVGGERAGWTRFETSHSAPAAFTPDGETSASDPLLLYFTSGTTAKPKLVAHTHQSYPVGHLSTMYWIGLMPGDVHFNISSPGFSSPYFGRDFFSVSPTGRMWALHAHSRSPGAYKSRWRDHRQYGQWLRLLTPERIGSAHTYTRQWPQRKPSSSLWPPRRFTCSGADLGQCWAIRDARTTMRLLTSPRHFRGLVIIPVLTMTLAFPASAQTGSDSETHSTGTAGAGGVLRVGQRCLRAEGDVRQIDAVLREVQSDAGIDIVDRDGGARTHFALPIRAGLRKEVRPDESRAATVGTMDNNDGLGRETHAGVRLGDRRIESFRSRCHVSDRGPCASGVLL